MNQHTRERALRAMTAALLSSELTPGEIREVARSFKTDPSLVEQLGRLVDTLVEHMQISHSEPKQIQPEQVDGAALDAEQFLRIAGTSKLPNDVLVRLLQSYAQNPDWKPRPMPRRRILSEFVKVAPASSLQPALRALLADPAKPDPYVELIMKRGKASNG
jgi:hypothetical protein